MGSAKTAIVQTMHACVISRRSVQQATSCANNVVSQRNGVRKRRAVATPQERPSKASQTQRSIVVEALSHDTRSSAPAVTEEVSDGGPSRPLAQPSHAFFSSHCLTSYYEDSNEATISESIVFDSFYMREAVLKSTQAAVLSRPALVQAWIDIYKAHAFHYCPVTEKTDLSNYGSSVLLHQSLCLIGNLLRHEASGPKLAQELYEKVKMLLSVNYEQNCLNNLKALCLVSCWSGKPSDPISLDGPEQWIGMAAHLILRMGLHRESTYATQSDKGCLHRIFWHIYVRTTSLMFREIF
jgi:hypothetical protein